jgi:hypothetical protein
VGTEDHRDRMRNKRGHSRVHAGNRRSSSCIESDFASISFVAGNSPLATS